jgi:hypothetical protein
MYMFTIYFIQGKCVDITLSHHLRLKVQCDFTYATKGFFSCKVDCNFFLIINLHFSTSACFQHAIWLFLEFHTFQIFNLIRGYYQIKMLQQIIDWHN